MSVYTPVDDDELRDFLATYRVGTLVEYSGISNGIENTNYFVNTSAGHYVLTLFEHHTAEEMPYFLDLMAHLAEHGVPSAHPVADREGRYLRILKDKPAALVQRLDGASIGEPDPAHCAALGAALGHMHLAGLSFPQQHDNPRGHAWRRETAARLLPHLSPEDAALIEAELGYQARHHFTELPRGVIHADLFRDNVLWQDGRLTGIIDFYYACSGPLLYDIAVAANDWCNHHDGSLDGARMEALLAGYHEQRPLEAAEREAWPVMLRAAALRFWLSRLHDLHFPRPGEITHTKDPRVFRRILTNRIERPATLREAPARRYGTRGGVD